MRPPYRDLRANCRTSLANVPCAILRALPHPLCKLADCPPVGLGGLSLLEFTEMLRPILFRAMLAAGPEVALVDLSCNTSPLSRPSLPCEYCQTCAITSGRDGAFPGTRHFANWTDFPMDGGSTWPTRRSIVMPQARTKIKLPSAGSLKPETCGTSATWIFRGGPTSLLMCFASLALVHEIGCLP